MSLKDEYYEQERREEQKKMLLLFHGPEGKGVELSWERIERYRVHDKDIFGWLYDNSRQQAKPGVHDILAQKRMPLLEGEGVDLVRGNTMPLYDVMFDARVTKGCPFAEDVDGVVRVRLTAAGLMALEHGSFRQIGDEILAPLTEIEEIAKKGEKREAARDLRLMRKRDAVSLWTSIKNATRTIDEVLALEDVPEAVKYVILTKAFHTGNANMQYIIELARKHKIGEVQQ